MGNPEVGLKVEAKIRTTDEIRKQFLPGEMGAILDWEVRNTQTGDIEIDPRTGKPNVGIKKAESFVRQFTDLLLVKFLNLPLKEYLLITDITGVAREITNHGLTFNTAAGIAGVVTNGIIVGLGNNPGAPTPTISDYVLVLPIAHDSGGHGANTLQYGGITYGAPSSDPTTSQFTITRNFANATAGAITVYEIGLYVQGYQFYAILTPTSGNNIYNFMTIHDGITGGIVVGVGQTLTVNYRPQCVI